MMAAMSRDELLDALSQAYQEIDSLRAQLAERDSFIHDLEANCDPAGTVRENTLLRDQTKQVNAMIGRLKSELAEAHRCIDHLADKHNRLLREVLGCQEARHLHSKIRAALDSKP